MNHRTEILSLRDALAVLRETPGQLIETNVEVDPKAELSGVYRHVGAGGTVMRPTQVDGPAMLFHNLKGHPGAQCVIGVLASRQRVANLFGCKKEELGHLVQSCAANPIPPGGGGVARRRARGT
ncbi:MAG: UbiD family decarboxylase, partial [Clostridiales bacterium]|nr:UbiD family decarboxylase [Clostridiales bacterium]